MFHVFDIAQHNDMKQYLLKNSKSISRPQTNKIETSALENLTSVDCVHFYILGNIIIQKVSLYHSK